MNGAAFETLVEKVKKRINEERKEPFKVSVMGQTGVGKSSLINALFATDFETDPVRPCTKEVQSHVIESDDGTKLEFFDLPGIGEAGPVSQKYIDEYMDKVEQSDVIIWALHADVRSVAQDEEALETMINNFNDKEMNDILSKMTFVLTKADLITEGLWVLSRDGDKATFAPTDDVKKILNEKEEYLKNIFIEPYGDSITSETYNEEGFDVDIPDFDYDEFKVTYDGMLSRKDVNELKEQHPEYVKTFDRLYDNYRVIPCSSYLKYNLYQLLLVLLNKLGQEAVFRFEEHLPGEELNEIPFPEALSVSNLAYYDESTGETVFNPENESEPDWWQHDS